MSAASAIAISPDGKAAKIRRLCGCVSVHDIGSCGGGGDWRKTPSRVAYAARLATSLCYLCRGLANPTPEVAVWHAGKRRQKGVVR